MNKSADGILAMLFPLQLCCHSCGCLLTASEAWLCTACRDALDQCVFKRKDEKLQFKPEQVLAASAYHYDGMAGDMVRSLKYGADKAAAQVLAEGMAFRFARMPELRAAQLCIAVPSFPRQVLRRGYAQAEVLCDAFCALAALPQQRGALRRIRYATSQVGKSRDERKKQIIGAFVFDAAYTQAVRGKTILLLDDVLTTGATVCECARMLYAAGAIKVLALTACRA